MRQRMVFGVCLVALATVATACPSPPGGGGGPVWSADGSGPPATPGASSIASPVGTTLDWYAEVAVNVDGRPDGLSFYPRVGPDGNQLGTPQTFSSATFSLDPGAMSDHLYVSETQQLDDRLLEFYVESGGTWSTAGTMSLTLYQNVMALTDESMAVLTVDPAEVDPAFIEVFDLDVVGGVVEATLNTTIIAPPSWGPSYVTTFGRSSVALDGDVLAVAAVDHLGVDPYRVAVYRRVAGSWTLADEMAGGPDHPAANVAIDDQGAFERLAIGSVGSTGAGIVELHGSSGGAWNLEEELAPPTGVLDDANGQLFGASIALDGDVLVAGLAKEDLPPEPGWPVRSLYHHSVFHLDTGVWGYEDRLTASEIPVDPTSVSVIPRATYLAGGHVVVASLIQTTECSSPCVSMRLEAWRFDRTPAP